MRSVTRSWLLFAFALSMAAPSPGRAKDPPTSEQEEIQKLVNVVKHAGYYGLRDPQEREAIASLRRQGERAMPAIASMLTEGLRQRKDGWIQVYRPLYILKGFGPAGKAALPDVIKALDDEHLINVGAAAEVLKDIGPGAREAVPALLRTWERSQASSQYTRKALAEAIKALDADAAAKLGIE